MNKTSKILLIFIVAILAIFTVMYFAHQNLTKTSNQLNSQIQNSFSQQTQNQTQPQTNATAPTKKTILSKIKLPSTGQISCYSNSMKITCPTENQPFYGQDAQHQTNNLSYRNNGDGTITDLNTGLMWIQKPGPKQQYNAVSGKNYSFAGYNDWHLPTIKELYSLIDFNGIDVGDPNGTTVGAVPFIDTNYFGFSYGNTSTGSRIIDVQEATSSIYTGKIMNGQECFFGVNFADGRIKCYPTESNRPNNNGYVIRYVRNDGDYGINDFVNNGDGTITDKSTGLMWQQNDSGKGMNWQSALSYCEKLKLAGYTDWRLPNAKELEYLVNYSRSPIKTDSPAINPIFQTTQITNEAGQKDWPYFWTSTTHADAHAGDQAVYISFGRAMGYMQVFGGWVDVHGAGAQRSDPKSGNPNQYPQGHGPQGDAIRINNYVRCVR